MASPAPTTPVAPAPASGALYGWLGASAVLFVMAATALVGGLATHDTETVCESPSRDVSVGDCYVATHIDGVWFDSLLVVTLVLLAGGAACLVMAGLASLSRGRSRS